MSVCGKVAYSSRRIAKKHARESMGRGAPRLWAYECKQGCPDGTWHLTSQDYTTKVFFREYDRDRIKS